MPHEETQPATVHGELSYSGDPVSAPHGVGRPGAEREGERAALESEEPTGPEAGQPAVKSHFGEDCGKPNTDRVGVFCWFVLGASPSVTLHTQVFMSQRTGSGGPHCPLAEKTLERELRQASWKAAAGL